MGVGLGSRGGRIGRTSSWTVDVHVLLVRNARLFSVGSSRGGCNRRCLIVRLLRGFLRSRCFLSSYPEVLEREAKSTYRDYSRFFGTFSASRAAGVFDAGGFFFGGTRRLGKGRLGTGLAADLRERRRGSVILVTGLARLGKRGE